MDLFEAMPGLYTPLHNHIATKYNKTTQAVAQPAAQPTAQLTAAVHSLTCYPSGRHRYPRPNMNDIEAMGCVCLVESAASSPLHLNILAHTASHCLYPPSPRPLPCFLSPPSPSSYSRTRQSKLVMIARMSSCFRPTCERSQRRPLTPPLRSRYSMVTRTAYGKLRYTEW